MNDTLYGIEHMENPLKPMALISARVVKPAAAAGLSIVTRMSTNDPETGPRAVAVGCSATMSSVRGMSRPVSHWASVKAAARGKPRVDRDTYQPLRTIYNRPVHTLL